MKKIEQRATGRDNNIAAAAAAVALSRIGKKQKKFEKKIIQPGE